MNRYRGGTREMLRALRRALREQAEYVDVVRELG